MLNNNSHFNRKHKIEFGFVVTETGTVRNEVKSFPADSVLKKRMSSRQKKENKLFEILQESVPPPQTKEFKLNRSMLWNGQIITLH